MTDPGSVLLPILQEPPAPVERTNRQNNEDNQPLVAEAESASPCYSPPSRQDKLAHRWSRWLSLIGCIWRSRRGLKQLPRMLTHTVTFGCNAKCIMCDSWQLPTHGELTLAEIEQIYSQLPKMDVVRLTGGEPFLRRDLPEIVDRVSRLLDPFLIYISSNGFLTERIVRLCEDRDRRIALELALSIDGVEEFHNHIRGSTIAWKCVWRTLTSLVSRQRELNLRLVVNQTIANDAGIHQYYELHELLEQHEVEHHVVIAYSESATYSLERSRAMEMSAMQGRQAFAELDQQRLLKLLEDAQRHALKLPWFRRLARRYYLRGVQGRIAEAPDPANPMCQALHAHLRIFPNGDVPVCQFNSRPVGTLRTSTFAEVWNSLRAEAERKWVRACPGCWAECEVLPSAVYSGDIIRQVSKPKQSPAKGAALNPVGT